MHAKLLVAPPTSQRIQGLEKSDVILRGESTQGVCWFPSVCENTTRGRMWTYVDTVFVL